MAATYAYALVTRYADANKRVRVFDVTVSGTYTTGGDAMAFPEVGTPQEVIVHNGASDGTVQYPVSFDYSTKKLKLWESGGTAGTAAAEKGSGESLTGITFRVTVKGTR